MWRMVPQSTIPPVSCRSVSPARAAKALDVSRRTVDRMIARRELRAFHIGKSVRVPVSELERIVSGSSLS